jgi:hypothetical protein
MIEEALLSLTETKVYARFMRQGVHLADAESPTPGDRRRGPHNVILQVPLFESGGDLSAFQNTKVSLNRLVYRTGAGDATPGDEIYGASWVSTVAQAIV